MVGPSSGGPAAPVPASPTAPTVLRRRALLFAPPPASAAAYVPLLESEGFDVLLAPDAASATALIRSAPPRLILAVAPALGPDLLRSWQELAPEADVRVVPGFMALLEDSVTPAGATREFAVRALASVTGLAAERAGMPPARVARLVAAAEAAGQALALGPRDLAIVQLTAALYPLGDLLGSETGPTARMPTGGATESASALADATFETRRRLLAEFAQGVGCPLPIGDVPADVPVEQRTATPMEIVEAAARFVALQEAGGGDPLLALRRASAGLHPAAVEAVIASARRAPEARGTVVIADPEAAARNLLALRLTSEGYTVKTVADGRAALEEIRRQAPALVIAEAVLPGLDGYALLDALKRDGKGQIPFVFVSSRSDAPSIQKGLLLGAADFLAKPLNIDVLLTKIQKILGRRIDASDVSRLTLSDVSLGGATAGYALVAYEELRAGVELMGRFKIEADLGEGGMGKVFKARDEKLEETVVLKVMKSTLAGDSKLLQHFKREIRLARKITHPGVVRIFDFWEAGDLNFVTMEFLEGQDLRQEIKRRGAFPIPVGLRVATELFDALHAAHEVGVVHRDIKPHNVLVLQTGRVKVLDFGIAQGLDASSQDSATITASVLGTPEYMSPEQILGDKLDVRTDLYSAGVLLYEMFSGGLPFRGENRMATANMHLRTPPEPLSQRNPQVPPAVNELVLRLLSKDREHRPAGARQVVDELNALRH